VPALVKVYEYFSSVSRALDLTPIMAGDRGRFRH